MLRTVAAVGLAIGAYVHADQAGVYGVAFDREALRAVPLGNLFVLQAVVGLLCCAWLAVSGSLRAWLAVLVVSGGSFLAVTVSRYVPIPGLGPIPSLYEPAWTEPALVSAVAEGASAAACVAALIVLRLYRPG